jgi:hypothetical protein
MFSVVLFENILSGKKIVIFSICLFYFQIRSTNPDVIAFQEVRCNGDQNENQIKEMQKLVPGYKWSFFKSSNRVQKPKHSFHKEYGREGILSIVSSENKIKKSCNYRISNWMMSHMSLMHKRFLVIKKKKKHILHISSVDIIIFFIIYFKLYLCSPVMIVFS